MEILIQAVAQLEKLIVQAQLGDDRSVLQGLMDAQDCLLEQIWPAANQADNDEVCSHEEFDPVDSTTHDTRTKITIS